MNKWKKRFYRLRDASMCRNVQTYLHVEQSTGVVTLRHRHACGDDCLFLKALDNDR